VRSTAPREDDVNNTTFPPPFGTWYSRWAFLYTDVPATAEQATTAPVVPVRGLPRLTAAA
jgi:hypothetical protein